MARKIDTARMALSPKTRTKLYATRQNLNVEVQEETGLRIGVEVYFKDPLVAKQNPAAAIDKHFLVPWEPGLADGPTSARFAVVDYDASTGVLEDPATWNPKSSRYVGPGGVLLDTDEGRKQPQFRQVSVWATVQHTLDFFEGGFGLGRRIGWGFDGNRLIVVPTAGYGENAYYDRASKSLQFYWFNGQDGRVNTCESSDIVNHEFGHAVLDGLRPLLFESLLTETAGFHEFMGDLTALLMAFRNNEFRAAVVKDSGGDLAHGELLTSLAAQFGQAVVGQPYLRSAINPIKMADIEANDDPHAASQVLTGAMFDIMVRVFETFKKKDAERTAEDPLAKPETAAKLFWYTIQKMQMSAIQPLDFLPPCDVTFRDYALAILRAERVTNPTDPDGYREKMLDVFIERGIIDMHDRTAMLKPESVFKRQSLRVFHSIEAIGASRGSAYRFLDDNRFDLLIPISADVVIADVTRNSKYTTEARRQPDQIVLQYIWREEASLKGDEFGQFNGQRTVMLCGGTIVLDQNGNQIHWARKPGTQYLGDSKAQMAETASGIDRLKALKAVLARRIQSGMIGEKLPSPLGLLARTTPPFEFTRLDGVVRFGLSPHFSLHHADNEDLGGRQWQISS